MIPRAAEPATEKICLRRITAEPLQMKGESFQRYTESRKVQVFELKLVFTAVKQP